MAATRKHRTRAAPHEARKPPRPAREARPRHPRRAQAGGGDVWVYGRHAARAALSNPARAIRRVLMTREAEAALGPLPGGVSPEIVDAGAIAAALPEGAAHQGIAVLAAPLPPVALEDALRAIGDDPAACVVVLDQVTDPGNVGAVMRSCAAFGAAAVILPERRAAEATAALAKAASGALERVALVRTANLSRALEVLKKAGFWCIGLEAHGGEAIETADLTGRIALVLGSEGRGLRRLVAETCDKRVRLPISDAVESLNVAAAAAIALYEVARRRRADARTEHG